MPGLLNLLEPGSIARDGCALGGLSFLLIGAMPDRSACNSSARTGKPESQ
ncbi:UNVERIFIED_ORG: hypothetical protein BDU10_9199 [Burkholderia sp. CF145]